MLSAFHFTPGTWGPKLPRLEYVRRKKNGSCLIRARIFHVSIAVHPWHVAYLALGTGHYRFRVTIRAPSPPRRSLNSGETVRGNKRSYPSWREALGDVAATGNFGCPDLLSRVSCIRLGPVSVGVGVFPPPHFLLVKALAGFYSVWEFCLGKSLWSKSWRHRLTPAINEALSSARETLTSSRSVGRHGVCKLKAPETRTSVLGENVFIRIWLRGIQNWGCPVACARGGIIRYGRDLG